MAEHVYEITVGGKTYEVVSPQPLTDMQVQEQFRALKPLEAANATPLEEPTTFMGGALKSAGETLDKTATGIGEGVVSGLESIPSAILHPLKTQEGMINAGRQALAHPLDTAKAVGTAATDPEQGGKMIGQLGTGLLLGPTARKTVGGLVSNGAGAAADALVNKVKNNPTAAATAIGGIQGAKRGGFFGGIAGMAEGYLGKGPGARFAKAAAKAATAAPAAAEAVAEEAVPTEASIRADVTKQVMAGTQGKGGTANLANTPAQTKLIDQLTAERVAKEIPKSGTTAPASGTAAPINLGKQPMPAPPAAPPPNVGAPVPAPKPPVGPDIGVPAGNSFAPGGIKNGMPTAISEIGNPGSQAYQRAQFAKNNPIAQQVLGRERVGGPAPTIPGAPMASNQPTVVPPTASVPQQPVSAEDALALERQVKAAGPAAGAVPPPMARVQGPAGAPGSSATPAPRPAPGAVNPPIPKPGLVEPTPNAAGKFTQADAEALGVKSPADIPKQVTTVQNNRLVAERAAREQMHRINGAMDKSQASNDLTPMQSALMDRV